MKIDPILTDSPYHVRHELGFQTSAYDYFGANSISEMVEMGGEYVNLGGRAHMLRSAVQYSSWIKTISTSTESVTFPDSESSKKEREKAVLDPVLSVLEKPAEFQMTLKLENSTTEQRF